MTYPHFGFYEDLYFRELESRDRITTTLMAPAGWLAGLAGGLAYLWSAVLADRSLVSWVCVGTVLASACWVNSLVNLLRAYYFHDWARLPPAVDIADYETALLNHYMEHGLPVEEAGVHFEQKMVRDLSEAADRNFLVNHNRLTRARKATMWLAAAFLLVAIASGLEVALG